MRTIILYIRSLFCKHEWEQLPVANYYNRDVSMEMPAYSIYSWRCTKCGLIMKEKI